MKQYRELNKERIKEYRELNKGRIKEQWKQWYELNKGRIKEYSKQRNKQYYELNKERIKERWKQYRELNKGRIKEYSKQRYELNKERIKEHDKQRYELNKERIKERVKQYQSSERGLQVQQRRYAKLARPLNMDAKQVKYALLSWSAYIRKKPCAVCNAPPEEAHHILYKKHYPELALNLNNGIPLCARCHHEVHGKNLSSLAPLPIIMDVRRKRTR